MQTKLTLTIEKNLINQAKLYAKNKGRSLSELIENYLKVVVDEQKEVLIISPSISKLKGSIHLQDDFNYKKELAKAILEKHQ